MRPDYHATFTAKCQSYGLNTGVPAHFAERVEEIHRTQQRLLKRTRHRALRKVRA